MVRTKLSNVVAAVFMLKKKSGAKMSEISDFMKTNYGPTTGGDFKKAVQLAVKEGFFTAKRNRFYPSSCMAILGARRRRRSGRRRSGRRRRGRRHDNADNILDARRRRKGSRRRRRGRRGRRHQDNDEILGARRRRRSSRRRRGRRHNESEMEGLLEARRRRRSRRRRGRRHDDLTQARRRRRSRKRRGRRHEEVEETPTQSQSEVQPQNPETLKEDIKPQESPEN